MNGDGYAARRQLLAALILATMTPQGACTCGGKTNVPPAAPADQTQADCDRLRPRVSALYEEQARAEASPDDSEETRALRAEIVEDNTHRVMVDCKTDPARFAPCIEDAASAAQMERECLIPLDDEGTVEGKVFGGK